MLGVFLDLETTGLDAKKHRILELAFRVMDLSTGEELSAYTTVIRQTPEVWAARDLTSIQINGFTEERMLAGKSEAAVREEVIQHFTAAGIKRGEALFICQNPSFDRNFLTQLIDIYEQEKMQWPYHWLDLASMYWALRTRAGMVDGQTPPKKFSVSKDAIATYYDLPTETKPHRAINGVDHLILCYRAVVGLPQPSRKS